jgi:hypothetical protein
VGLRLHYWQWQLGAIGGEGVIRRDIEGQMDSYSAYGPRQCELNVRLIAHAAQSIRATPVLLTQARLVSSSNGEAERKRIGYHYINLSIKALCVPLPTAKAVFSAAKAADIPVLDLSDMFTGHSELFVDHVHTTPAGSDALARATAAFLGGILDGRREGMVLGR